MAGIHKNHVEWKFLNYQMSQKTVSDLLRPWNHTFVQFSLHKTVRGGNGEDSS